jgi:prepilin-type N-terminal cleavage/methylation domain-containing protein/prepilin-type processing-associated H-X9-DG protein
MTTYPPPPYRPRPAHRRAAFTLVELLVVIGIIAILVGILMPALISARKASQTVQCGSNVRQIGMAVRLYLDQNKNRFPAYHPNGGLWRDQSSGAMFLETDDRAYWGVVYLPFLLKSNPDYDKQVAQGAGATSGLAWARSLFQCPASAITDTDPGWSENYTSDQGATFGLNNLITGRKTTEFRNAAETIVAHDAWEHKLEGNAGGDWLMAYSIGSGPGGIYLQRQSKNILQYAHIPQARVEYYRHKRKCQVLWLDGHVSFIDESDGTDIPPHYYAGTVNVRVQ